ncbi:hypothetical protein OUZ56_028861 [Daphnia magna]|uniref:Uncharacterized protein n=1 Tax=Daphnia magna TaxID=35525 RepID=A0ABR0B584_9CRUS|nr:hypothetical protein OUZ56_028861 [Daphnia magna]
MKEVWKAGSAGRRGYIRTGTDVAILALFSSAQLNNRLGTLASEPLAHPPGLATGRTCERILPPH